MLRAFSDYIKKEQLFALSETVLLAVSGGIDSVVLCELFHQSGLKFAIAHCNFRLRADESNKDESFVAALAKKYKAAFHSTSFDTAAFSKKNKLSIQAAARQLRYSWFETIRQQNNYTSIATAHHADDSVETFLINLVRGTGIAGLHGILPKQGKIIRPLLFTNKENIIAFAKKNKLKHREDSSNASDKYLRNKIRHTIIPALKELNPAIEKNISSGMERLREVEVIYKNAMEQQRKNSVQTAQNVTSISIRELQQLQPTATYLYEFLKPYHFNGDAVKSIIKALDGASGKQFLSDTHRLIKDRDLLLIEEIQPLSETITITKKTKEIRFNDQHLAFKTQKLNPAFKISASVKTASLDADKLKFPLTIRSWKEGDTFRPLGMKGKKKLSDFFIDQKLSIIKKQNVRLLCSGNDIVWLIGYRIDDRFKMTEKTSRIFLAELTE